MMTNEEREKEIRKLPIPNKEECIAFYEELTKLADVRFVPYYKMAIEALEQQPKTGHWIPCDILQEFKCSECRRCFGIKTNFCPNCGADMRGEDNDNK